MNEHRWSSPRRGFAGLVAALFVLIGLAAAAPSAHAQAPALDQFGCPSGGNRASALPCATFELGCPKFGLGLALRNAAGAALDARFVVTVDGTVNHEGAGVYIVKANDSTFPVVHIGENTTVRIRIEETVTSRVFVDDTFTRDCTHPAATIAQPGCNEAGALVTMTNPSSLTDVDFVITAFDAGSAVPTRTFNVDDVGTAGATFLVPGGGGVQVRIVVTALTPEGSNRAATVEAMAERTVVVGCVQPPVTPPPTTSTTAPQGAPSALASHECGTGVLVRLVAPGSGTTSFDVTLTDAGGVVLLHRVVTINGVGSDSVTGADAVDGVVHVVVTSGGATLVDTSLTVDCTEVLPSSTVPTTGALVATTRPPTSVLGVQVSRQLPRTGSNGAGPQTLVAVGFVLAGIGLVGFGAVPRMAARRLPRHARR